MDEKTKTASLSAMDRAYKAAAPEDPEDQWQEVTWWPEYLDEEPSDTED